MQDRIQSLRGQGQSVQDLWQSVRGQGQSVQDKEHCFLALTHTVLGLGPYGGHSDTAETLFMRQK